jgi:hypothetical protein
LGDAGQPVNRPSLTPKLVGRVPEHENSGIVMIQIASKGRICCFKFALTDTPG